MRSDGHYSLGMNLSPIVGVNADRTRYLPPLPDPRRAEQDGGVGHDPVQGPGLVLACEDSSAMAPRPNFADRQGEVCHGITRRPVATRWASM